MTGANRIVEEAREYVTRLLREKLAPWVKYHDARHSEETAQAAEKIAAASGLNAMETEVVIIAAWFHDVGYTETSNGHEARGAAIAEEFLRGRDYPADRIGAVTRCIMATVVPQRPATPMERVLCDADMLNIGTDAFFPKNEVLKSEMERWEGRTFPKSEWLARTLEFLRKQQYHTEYCRNHFGPGIAKNIDRLTRELEPSR